jgi:superfamily II DNA helicase RecQ
MVLPTGSSKTLLFIAGAYLDDLGVIVVIMPYRKLVDETVRNVRVKGINYIEWKYSMSSPTNMVIVSIDNFLDRFL